MTEVAKTQGGWYVLQLCQQTSFELERILVTARVWAENKKAAAEFIYAKLQKKAQEEAPAVASPDLAARLFEGHNNSTLLSQIEANTFLITNEICLELEASDYGGIVTGYHIL